jgi:hypothetical protein
VATQAEVNAVVRKIKAMLDEHGVDVTPLGFQETKGQVRGAYFVKTDRYIDAYDEVAPEYRKLLDTFKRLTGEEYRG